MKEDIRFMRLALEEAQKAAAVLGSNYPGSEWYQKAFDLMQKHAPGTTVS